MAKRKRKICVVTNTRADYSRLKTLLSALKARTDVELVLCVAGSHLLPVRGHTIDEIERDGFSVDYRLYTEVDGHTLTSMAKSTGLAILEFTSFFENNRPDIVVVHGDRFEAFAAASAASMMNIHVAHLQGGEITGTIDEHLRHAITKLSHFHFPSDPISEKRIHDLGEVLDRVFNIGCPSTDVLVAAPKSSFEDFKRALALKIKKEGWIDSLTNDFFLVVQHPVTTEYETTANEVGEILAALKGFPNHVLALWPNIDAGAEGIVEKIKAHEREVGGAFAVIDHMPMEVFLNAMRHARVLIGNSSAGVREASYFGTPVVNVGSRQEGRLRTKNVIDVHAEKSAIARAIKTQLKKKRYTPSYPYGKGNSGKKIAEILAKIQLGSPQKKLVSKR